VQRAMQINPDSVSVLTSAGFAYCYVGRPEPAIKCLSRALGLTPPGLEATLAVSGLGLAHLLAGRPEEALDYTERAMHAAPDWNPTLRHRIVALMSVDRVEEARALARRLLGADPGFRLSTRPVNFGYGAMRLAYRSGLRDAGLPE
jgi:adenylate cyclase